MERVSPRLLRHHRELRDPRYVASRSEPPDDQHQHPEQQIPGERILGSAVFFILVTAGIPNS